MRLELSQEQISLLEMGSKIQYSEDEFLYFLPVWFKIKSGSSIADTYHLEKLPPEIKSTIEKFRL